MYFPRNYLPCDYCMFRQLNTQSTFVRVLHASFGTPKADVYANGKLIAGNLGYKEFTPYVKLLPGNYMITVFKSGTTVNPVSDSQITLGANTIYTAAIIGRQPGIEIYPVFEPRVPTPPGRANIRVVHLSPNAPAVDITTPDGKIIFANVKYKDITNYTSLSQGRHTIQARISGTSDVALNVPNIVLKPNRNYTIYIVGLAGEKPGLQVLIPLDGSTYLTP